MAVAESAGARKQGLSTSCDEELDKLAKEETTLSSGFATISA